MQLKYSFISMPKSANFSVILLMICVMYAYRKMLPPYIYIIELTQY